MIINGINIEGAKININHLKTLSSKTSTNTSNFTKMLSNAIEDVNEAQINANQHIKDMLIGKNKNIHETMIAIEKAEIKLKLMATIKNKALEAYQSLMRTNI